MKKTTSIIALLLVILILAGCGEPKWSSLSEAEITKVLQQEKGVLNGKVYRQGELIIATMAMDPKSEEKTGKALTEKYADILAKRNPDLNVNVQAVRDGENIANIYIEAKK